MKLIKQTVLHYREGNSDKVYEVDLCEADELYVVQFRYGRRGATLKEGTKTNRAAARDEAERVFDDLVNSKLKKGYTKVGDKSARQSSQSKPSAARGVDETAREEAILQRLAGALPATATPRARQIPAQSATWNATRSGSARPWKLERVIWRAGELRLKTAAPFLIDLIGTGDALRDYSIAWALGWCAGAEALPSLRRLFDDTSATEAVRRIAGEALLKLSDEETRAAFRLQVTESLPPELRRDTTHEGTDDEFAAALRDYLQADSVERCLVLETLYLVDDEGVRPALFDVLRTAPLRPNYFKPLRHIFKRAEYRRDAEAFGLVARRIEREVAMYRDSYWNARYIYVRQNDNSYNYVEKNTLKTPDSKIAYGSLTRDYLRRRVLRTLRHLGELGDVDYVKMAVGVLLPYTDADKQEVRESSYYDWQTRQTRSFSFDAFAPYLAFNYILYANSPRYEYKSGWQAWRCQASYKPGNSEPPEREEAFPELWEKQPTGLLHLLSESECQPVHHFAVKALRACAEFCAALDTEAVIMLLGRPFEVTAQLGYELARERYHSDAPDVNLVIAVTTCANPEARAEGRRWIEAGRELFVKNGKLISALLLSVHPDARLFAVELLRASELGDRDAQIIIGQLIANLLALDESRRDGARDIAAALLAGFSPQLRKIGINVIRDLLAHPLVEVQELGGQILLQHDTKASELPGDIINALIESPHEAMRAVGMELFGQLPDEVLRERAHIILSLLSHHLADVHDLIRPVVRRLTGQDANFVSALSEALVAMLLLPETHEGVHARLARALREDLTGWTITATPETARSLVATVSPAAQEAGGALIRERAREWSDFFTTEEIVKLTGHEVKAIREASWALAANVINRFHAVTNPIFYREELSIAVRALDAKWEDSRRFWFDLFKVELSGEDLTPEILINICDSAREDVQKFARDLLLTRFAAKDGHDYLLKLSEHPSAGMQLFVADYLESFAANDADRLRYLAPYFVRVLAAINRARVAKRRVYAFLEAEALKDESAARIVADILTRQSATVVVGDRAKAIEIMLRIHRAHPSVSLPLNIKAVEVRANAV